jgi:two-component system sensor histidine kinase AlgZ
MPSSSLPAVAPNQAVIPDCCNIGVVFRTLLAVNAVIVSGTLLQSADLRAGLFAFAEGSIVVELSCLWSLFLLCVARKMLLRNGNMQRLPLAAQRLLCALLPGLVTGIVSHLFISLTWFSGSFVHLTTTKAALAAAALGLVFQHYFELRMRAYSPAIVEARLQALQARIRPHFLFNSLNAVLSLIRSEPRRAESTLEDLAELFRVLMSDPRSMTTLDEELRLCKQYLSIEHVRLGDRLQVEWEIDNIGDEVLHNARVPVLLVQPLLENAVHYGVEPATEPVMVQVRVGRVLDALQVTVINPYHGDMPALAGNKIALRNIRERLELLYDLEAQLTTTIVQDRFEARLRFPYSKTPT